MVKKIRYNFFKNLPWLKASSQETKHWHRMCRSPGQGSVDRPTWSRSNGWDIRTRKVARRRPDGGARADAGLGAGAERSGRPRRWDAVQKYGKLLEIWNSLGLFLVHFPLYGSLALTITRLSQMVPSLFPDCQLPDCIFSNFTNLKCCHCPRSFRDPSTSLDLLNLTNLTWLIERPLQIARKCLLNP